MGINLVTAKTIKRDVTIETPTSEVYKVENVEFTYLTEDQWKEKATQEGDDAIADLIVGWDEFLDADKENIEFSPEAVAELMALRYAQVAFITTYARAIMGVDTKNFAASLALGRMSLARTAKKPKGKKNKSKRN